MKILLLILMLFIFSAVGGQVSQETGEELEQLAEEDDQDPGGEEWMEAREHLLRHPVSVNTATEEDLQLLRLLNPLQIRHLLQYRSLFGPLLHVYELQAVPGWDPETVRKLLPYVTVAATAAAPFKKIVSAGAHRLAATWGTQLQTAAGYNRGQADHFAGGKARVLLRYRFSSDAQLRWGYTAEKDAGEPFSKAVFDFHSFHFFWKRPGRLRTIALGDYTINMGQGLIHWQSLAFKKSSEVLAVRRQSAVILPYQSSGEFYFNRGVAVGAGYKKLSAHLFFSHRALDGKTEKDSTTQTTFSSFDISGWHRTNKEQAGRGSVHQLSYGGNLHYQGRWYRVGINGIRHQLAIPLQKADALYQQFSIKGTLWMNGSFDYQATRHNVHFFGEFAVDRNGAPAAINGLLLSLDKSLDLSVLHRAIGKKYQSLYGSAFTEQRLPSNENGLYAGLRLRSRSWRLDAYYDMFRFPWLRFRADAPGTGHDCLLQLSYQPGRLTEITLRFRRESKPLNDSGEEVAIHTVSQNIRSGLRLNAAMQLNRTFLFRARMESSRHLANGSLPAHGFLFYTEGNLQTSFRAVIQARLMFFETEGFNSRIYAHESDVYGFSIPALYDKGFRFYLNLRYNLTRNLSCWLRYAQTTYSNRDESGSGLNLVKGNTVSDVKIQASYRF